MLSYTSCFLAQAACFLKTPGTAIGILPARVKNLKPSLLLQTKEWNRKRARIIQHSNESAPPPFFLLFAVKCKAKNFCKYLHAESLRPWGHGWTRRRTSQILRSILTRGRTLSHIFVYFSEEAAPRSWTASRCGMPEIICLSRSHLNESGVSCRSWKVCTQPPDSVSTSGRRRREKKKKWNYIPTHTSTQARRLTI